MARCTQAEEEFEKGSNGCIRLVKFSYFLKDKSLPAFQSIKIFEVLATLCYSILKI